MVRKISDERLNEVIEKYKNEKYSIFIKATDVVDVAQVLLETRLQLYAAKMPEEIKQTLLDTLRKKPFVLYDMKDQRAYDWLNNK